MNERIIDTTGYTQNDMDFINRNQKEIKKIQQKLLKIPGFVKEVSNPAEQLQLAEDIFKWMVKGMPFDSALVLAQKRR